MKNENFIYWLQGFMEIQKPKKLGKKKTQVIKNHVNLALASGNVHNEFISWVGETISELEKGTPKNVVEAIKHRLAEEFVNVTQKAKTFEEVIDSINKIPSIGSTPLNVC